MAVFAQAPEKDEKQKKDTPTMTAAGDEVRGKAVYQRNCAICHHAASTAKKIGPGLKNIYERKSFGDGRTVNDDNMRSWIEDGGKDMPQFKNTLKSAQVRDLIAYLRTL